MISLLKTPKFQLAIILFLISLSAIFLRPEVSKIILILISLGSAILFDLLLTYIRSKKLFLPLGAIVSGLIIGLIIDPNATFFQILSVNFIAMAIKNFLRVGNRHIFNPAAAGLVFGGVIFNLPVAWWGVSFEKLIALLIILLPAYVSLYRLRRYGTFLSFWIVYLLINSLFQWQSGTFNLNSLIQSVLNPSLLFFSLVMLPEPMTSPINLKRQILFGGLVAIMTPLLSLFLFNHLLTSQIFSVDPILIPLLIANLIFFRYR